MKIRQRNNKLAQVTIGYIILIIVFIAAFAAITAKLRQKIQASYKESADTFGEGRQLGKLSTSGGVPEFVFPVLPGNPVPPCVGCGNPPPLDPECDLANLEVLRKDALEKQEKARILQQEAGEARSAAGLAQGESVMANEAARVWRERAIKAALGFYDVCSDADDKQQECRRCNTDCTAICDEAAELADVCSKGPGILAELNRIADEKEAIAKDKKAVADRLDKVATVKEQAAKIAGDEAQAAADAYQNAQEDCYKPPPPHCFLKGTKVALADGTSKPIEEIKKGDMVFSYDGKQVKTGKVVKIFFHPKTKGYRIISTEEGQQINVTDIHPLFNGKTYVVASRFKVGDSLFLLKDNKLQAVKIKSIEIKNSINDVYNLEVDKLHNYFAEGVLCHNKPPPPPPLP